MAMRRKRKDAEMQEAGRVMARVTRKADMYRKLVATPSVLVAAGLFTLSGIAGGFLTFGQTTGAAPEPRPLAQVEPVAAPAVVPPVLRQVEEVVEVQPAPAPAPVVEAPTLVEVAEAPAVEEEVVFSSGSVDAETGREERRAATLPQLTEEQAQICRDNLQAAADRLSVLFPNGSTDDAPEDMDDANSFAEGVAVCSGLRVLVGGHADSRGDETQNLILSWERAEAVIDAIAAAGHDITIYEPVGYGSRRLLIEEGADAEAEALNRRVEFSVVSQRQ